LGAVFFCAGKVKPGPEVETSAIGYIGYKTVSVNLVFAGKQDPIVSRKFVFIFKKKDTKASRKFVIMFKTEPRCVPENL